MFHLNIGFISLTDVFDILIINYSSRLVIIANDLSNITVRISKCIASVSGIADVYKIMANLHNYGGLALRRRFYIAVGESTVAVFPGYALSQNKNKTTVSYKTFRENLLIFLNEDLINYETFALLYDIDTSSNLDFPYGIYDTFDLDLICDDEYNWYGIHKLNQVLRVPENFVCSNRVKIKGKEAP